MVSYRITTRRHKREDYDLVLYRRENFISATISLVY